MTNKEVVPYAELLAKVQGVLASCAECRNIHVDGLELYPEHVDGANWAIGTFGRSGDENDLPACLERILPEIRSLRARYDSGERA